MARIERQHASELEPEFRSKNFNEVTAVLNNEKAAIEASRCINCKNAPCVHGCPVGIDIPKFISLLKGGDFASSYAVLKEASNLPAICGRVCPQETQCEKYCIRNKMEGSVSIGALERFVADKFSDKSPEFEIPKPTGKKVCVVGSGPSGLTVAGDLAKAGVEVVIYEAFHKSGGVLTYGIPEFRLPKCVVKKEINDLKNLGVKIEHNVVVGKTFSLAELREKFDAVYLSSGAGLPMFLGIPGEGLSGVLSANELLTRVNLMKAHLKESATPVKVGKTVAVIGAGNVAMDAARVALRLGAERVMIVYRRSEEEMPARAEELRHAKEEGVEFKLLTNPVRIEGENGCVTKIVCVKMELGEPDASGRRRPNEIKGSEFDLPCDTVIVSLGTKPNPLISSSSPELAVDGKGLVTVSENNQTNLDNVWAGGDMVSGAATVILAMGAGKTAAKAILKKLGV